MAEIHKFQPVDLPGIDEKLESAKSQDLTSLLIIGEMEDGSLYIESDMSVGAALFLIEKAKHQIVFEDD